MFTPNSNKQLNSSTVFISIVVTRNLSKALLFLLQVCEVYKLHRETFHLTVDYVDRYLSNTEDVQKGRLQLIGKQILRLLLTKLIRYSVGKSSNNYYCFQV